MSKLVAFAAIKSIVTYGALITIGGLVFGCLLFLLFRFAVASLRLSLAENVVRRPFHRFVFLTFVAIGCFYGGAKNDGVNGAGAPAGLCGSRSSAASSVDGMPDEHDDTAMNFTSFGINSNILSFSLSWTTNCLQAKSWIELYERMSALTNPWMPLLVREVATGVTNDSFSIALTNGVPPASFYVV